MLGVAETGSEPCASCVPSRSPVATAARSSSTGSWNGCGAPCSTACADTQCPSDMRPHIASFLSSNGDLCEVRHLHTPFNHTGDEAAGLNKCSTGPEFVLSKE